MVIAKIEKEINESGASVANYRDNIRVRKLRKEIAETQTEIDSHDMEDAARARRNFQEKYAIAKEKENNLHTAVSLFNLPLIHDLNLCSILISLAKLAPINLNSNHGSWISRSLKTSTSVTQTN